MKIKVGDCFYLGGYHFHRRKFKEKFIIVSEILPNQVTTWVKDHHASYWHRLEFRVSDSKAILFFGNYVEFYYSKTGKKKAKEIWKDFLSWRMNK